MIKVEVLRNDKIGSTQIIFESRSTDRDSLDLLDEIYSALLSNRPKIGGYTGSNRFKIEVKDED
jgi:hypothetical protein